MNLLTSTVRNYRFIAAVKIAKRKKHKDNKALCPMETNSLVQILETPTKVTGSSSTILAPYPIETNPLVQTLENPMEVTGSSSKHTR